jgi:CMP-N-acetylneuraminic acid synthetase
MTVWALVPARGGSKSIRLKNLAPVAGVPLLDFGIRAAQQCRRIDRIICSTDHDEIAGHARALGVEVDRRPASLATDEAPVADVARELLGRLGVPDILVLVQPTSPFLLPAHIEALLDALDGDREARSGQTVTRCPHNHHAWNQREVEHGRVRFRFADERAAAYNKQRKPPLYVFGNLVAVRGEAIAAGGPFFAEPSVAVEIPPPYDFDLDAPDDLMVAEALVAHGAVHLPHLPLAAAAASSHKQQGEL